MSLADQQAQLVAALTAGGPPPAGMDTERLAIATRALLRKRAGEVARRWPLLAAGTGADWYPLFAEWARARPTRGSLQDGWDLARELDGQGRLPELARPELAAAQARWRYDGDGPPRPRRGRVALGKVRDLGGRVRQFGRPPTDVP